MVDGDVFSAVHDLGVGVFGLGFTGNHNIRKHGVIGNGRNYLNKLTYNPMLKRGVDLLSVILLARELFVLQPELFSFPFLPRKRG